LDRLQPFELVREIAAGIAGAVAFAVCHWLATFPHWQMPGVDIALEAGIGMAIYTGVRLTWAERPGLIERWLGLEVPLRPEVADNNPESLRAALRYTVDAARPRVSEPVQQAIDRVGEAVEAVLAVYDAAAASNDAAYTLHATVTEYLPDTLERYLRLPQRYATERKVRGDRTPRDLVLEQLKVLADELESIADEIHAGNASELAAHGRFLQQRFSRQDPLKGSPPK